MKSVWESATHGRRRARGYTTTSIPLKRTNFNWQLAGMCTGNGIPYILPLLIKLVVEGIARAIIFRVQVIMRTDYRASITK